MKRFVYDKPEHWERKEKVRTWIQVPSGLTLNEFIAWAREKGIDFDQGKPSATFHIEVYEPETEEKYAERIAKLEDAEARHRAFIKQRYAEILEAESEDH